jgi:hypothetical protein
MLLLILPDGQAIHDASAATQWACPWYEGPTSRHDLLPLGFGACEFFVRQLLLARGNRIVELPLSSFVFNEGCRR